MFQAVAGRGFGVRLQTPRIQDVGLFRSQRAMKSTSSAHNPLMSTFKFQTNHFNKTNFMRRFSTQSNNKENEHHQLKPTGELINSTSNNNKTNNTT